VNPLWRYYPTAVWTGTEMIVWGGGSYLNHRRQVTLPSTDTWVPDSNRGCPFGAHLSHRRVVRKRDDRLGRGSGQ
jgi:hypothetical protein